MNALAAARAALAVQPDEIVAFRVRVELPGQSATVEQWTATDPKRWRSVRVINGDRVEAAYDGNAQSWLMGDALRVQEGLGEDGNFADLPTAIGFSGSNPETDVQAMLAADKLADHGEIEAGGRTLLAITPPPGTKTVVQTAEDLRRERGGEPATPSRRP